MIELSTQQAVRVIELADGKINFLSLPLREALLAALKAADADASVSAVVLIGRGKCFSAGMNVDDFEAGTALVAPSLHNEILDTLAQMTKPVVAAIHGGAHGGGLELALGCHYRVAEHGAKVSLPEVLVGMMPGARGTQHLPRAVGLAAAADMILNGRRVSAEDAPHGLFDLVLHVDLMQGALDFARKIADARPLPRLQDRSVADTVLDLREVLEPNHPPYPGIDSAISALRAAVDLPYDDAVAKEFAAFNELKDTDASKRFRAAFVQKLKSDALAKRAKQREHS